MVNGTTEYAVSGEYGSASEGALQLSADGRSLVILGYGVNAAAFNTAGATGNSVYGNAALGQSTSIPGGTYTPVARIVADIGADATIDTSTSLYNIYNVNNPRSVATVNGSTFYLSGQGVKGSTNQGVLLATDGASTATAIDTSTDTREAEIYNGQLYVSRDTTQGGAAGTSDIASYGASLPTTATAPAVPAGHRRQGDARVRPGQHGERVRGGHVRETSAPKGSSSPTPRRSTSPMAASRRRAVSAMAACRNGAW